MDDGELFAPRSLNISDISHLRTMFELQLHITDDGDEADATDLIDYAIDMIRRGKNVGSVVEELEFMEYKICDATVAQKIGKCLTSYILEMVREMEGEPNKLDLSTKASSRKPSREMHETLLAVSVTAAQRSKMQIYNSRGELKKQWADVNASANNGTPLQMQHFKHLEGEYSPQNSITHGEGNDGVNFLSARAAAAKPSIEIEALNATAHERKGIKNQIYNENGQLNAWCGEEEECEGKVDLSARASARKHHNEVESLLHYYLDGDSVKKQIYDESGQLHADWSLFKNGSPVECRGSLADQRQREFEAIMRDRSLSREERSARIEEMKEKFAATSLAHCSAANGPHDVNLQEHKEEIKLGAVDSVRKKDYELDALRAAADQRKGLKSQIYDSSGKLKAWTRLMEEGDIVVGSEGGMSLPAQSGGEMEQTAKGNTPDSKEVLTMTPKNHALDQQRKQEFRSIMRDRTLSREERLQRIKEMKTRQIYSALPHDATQGENKEEGSGIDLSALAFARKTNAEMKATLLSKDTSAKERNKQEIYDSNGVLIKQWSKVNEFIDGVIETSICKVDNRSEEIQTNERLGQGVISIDDQRRLELRRIMKNRNLGREEKNRMMEEVKLKFDLMEEIRGEQNGSDIDSGKGQKQPEEIDAVAE
eukprot:CAMPEP_0183728434 /NCGR_PEP_ID=MMETSP0737-20130205/28046_1 /TAXON_ID=385413 /ORGANISM="Thalassiosira miniscula, Strain CCMP1093" /LENGTH=652 /DNA_ID=CAMNT_0025960373 /DNA_START=122 /DNA_END=2080 /DNA_ORIENTATION=+